jgi:hypothetical protein
MRKPILTGLAAGLIAPGCAWAQEPSPPGRRGTSAPDAGADAAAAELGLAASLAASWSPPPPGRHPTPAAPVPS